MQAKAGKNSFISLIFWG